MRIRVASLMLALLFTSPAWAMSLNEAMATLSHAKASGQVGEQPNGYLGAVDGSSQGTEIANLINQARRDEYQRLAQQNGIQLGDVEAIAGKKAIEKTPAGQYIQLNGKWVKK
ncbi:YdbL family protein [Pseudomonas luteola]